MGRHVDRSTLALRALGEPAGSPAEDDHLEHCEHCATELVRLAHVAREARTLDAADRDPPPPPAAVWRGIAEATGVAQPGEASPTPTAQGEASPTSDVPRLRPRHPRAASLAAAASIAAVGLLGVGWLAGLVPAPSDDPPAEVAADPPAEAEVIDVVGLEPLDDALDDGQAALHDAEGDRLLTLDVPSLPEFDGYYEVWLIDEAVEGMVSLGPLDLERGHVVPAGVDVAAFPIVDVSREPHDGDPTHSGDSVWRGVLGEG